MEIRYRPYVNLKKGSDFLKQLIPLLDLIKDGNFVSGVTLAKNLNVSRATISLWMKDIERYGITVHKVSGKGYRLSDPIVLHDREQILEYISVEMKSKLKVIDIAVEVDSTNRNALAAEYLQGDWRLYLTEYQSEGRGRRGKTWLSPLGANLLFSLGHKATLKPEVLYLASIVCGLAVVEVIQKLTTDKVMLKWPNDIYVRDRKLAGILCELQGTLHDEPILVMGIGINVKYKPSHTDIPAIRIIDFASSSVSRDQLVAEIAENIIAKIEQADTTGLEVALSGWREADYLFGKKILVTAGPNAFEGIAQGINESGQLIVVLPDGTAKTFSGGEVSVRW